MATAMPGPTIVMHVGEFYRFNFPQSPAGTGTFQGWTEFGFMIFQNLDGETVFYNPALLCTIRPETYPAWQG